VGILIRGKIYKDLIKSESVVAEFSGSSITIPEINTIEKEGKNEKNVQVQLLTEEKIRDSLLREFDSAQAGESIDIAMFYLSDRKIVKALLRASERGVDVRLILDANKDAFAREKSGIPNRQVAYELVKKSQGKIQIRWYQTSGEQFHSKMIIIKKSDGRVIVFIGSANLTKRNIGRYNLETNVKVISLAETGFSQEVLEYYEKLWSNKDAEYTIDFKEYGDDSKYWLYRFQEASGFSSF